MKETEKTSSSVHYESNLKWRALEFTYYPKSRAWFATLFSIATAFLIIALLMQNYIFALLILLAAFLIFVQAQKRPREVEFAVGQEGILIDGRLHDYKEMKSFWIFEEPEIKSVGLHVKKILWPHLQIPYGTQDPKIIREVLRKFLPEKKQEESLTDILARQLKL